VAEVGVILARAVVDAAGQPLDAWWIPGLILAAGSSLVFVLAVFLRDYAISRNYRQLLEGKS
jgi:hypothetical protein